MCWNLTIEWTGPNGQRDRIPQFLETLLAFLMKYPDDGTETFPERVAKHYRENPNQITDLDISAARKLVARPLGDAEAEALEGQPITGALNDIPPDLMLFYLSENDWQGGQGHPGVRPKLQRLLEACLEIDNVGPAVATKVLYLKRPHLIPICDQRVRSRLLANEGEDAEAILTCIDKIREIGRENLASIADAVNWVQQHLPDGDAYSKLSMVRAVEMAIWLEENEPRSWRYYTALLRG